MKKQRTLRQNRALHLFFTLVADSLNEKGFDMRKTLKEDIEINWTPENVKEYLWKPVQKTLLVKKSTTELTTDEIDKVYEVLTRYLAEKTGIVQEFPSIETIMLNQMEE